MPTPQKKLCSGWSLAGQNNGENLEKGSNVLPDQEYINVSQESNEQTIMNLREKLSELENELYDYQYHMGLLLIEKKEWISNYEKLQQAFAETKDTLDRKQTVISDMEKREENLRKALGVEKQCVVDLEKALNKMRSQHAEIRFTSDLKLVEANALVTGIGEKSLEAESKLRAADVKDADLSRKNLEIERKLNEVDIRENALQRERLSFNTEREAQTSNISKQREDLREWERKLQESELRLEEVKQSLNQREKLADENDRIHKWEQIDMEGAQEKIEKANSSLKNKDEDISRRVEKLTFREKESDAMRKSLEIKEKELLELEEKLNVREQVEVQRLLDEHNTVLKSKNDDFEFEMEQKRKSLEDDMRIKVVEVEKKVDIVNSMEEKVAKREQELDKRHARLKEKEKDFESKLKDLKARENYFSVEEKKMENEKKKLIMEEEELYSLKAQTEKSRVDMEEERQKIKNESEILKLTEEERVGHSLLQLELKKEVDKCKSQSEQLLKEREDLKQEKNRFEKEWEDLDEKKRLSDEERDKKIKEINYLREVVGKKMEEMRLESSRIENEKQEILTNQKHLDEQQLEMRRNNDELVHLSNKLKELREQFFKEKEHFLKFVEKHKSCKNCGDPFPEFVHSNLQSLASLDDIKTLTLPHFTEIYSKGNRSIHDRPVSEATSRAIDSGSPASTGTMSWLQKCTSKILTFSSGKKNDPASTNQDFSVKHVHIESPQERLYSTDDDSELQFGVAEDNLDLKNMQSNDCIREVGNGLDPAVNEHSKSNSEAHNFVENSQHSDQKLDPRKCGKRGRGKANIRRTVKTVLTDVKLRRGDAPDINENEQNKLNKVGKKMKMQRKRSHSRASRSKRSDSDYTYTGGDSDSETAGGRRKRRHKVVPPVQTTSGQRYNLRRRKTEAKSDPNNGKDKGIKDGNGREETVGDAEDVKTFSSAETKVAVKSGVRDAKMALREEVDCTEKGSKEGCYQEKRGGFDEKAEVDETDEEAAAAATATDYGSKQHAEASSIHRKLWDFLTT